MHLDPKGTIKKLVVRADTESAGWYLTYYVLDYNNAPVTEVIIEQFYEDAPTALSDSQTDLQDHWTTLHPVEP